MTDRDACTPAARRPPHPRRHEDGDQLRALLAIVEEQLDLLEADVERLYDDWFIETCQEWVVPYIGDLLGVRGLLPRSRARRSASAASSPTRSRTAAPRAPSRCSSSSRAT